MGVERTFPTEVEFWPVDERRGIADVCGVETVHRVSGDSI